MSTPLFEPPLKVATNFPVAGHAQSKSSAPSDSGFAAAGGGASGFAAGGASGLAAGTGSGLIAATAGGAAAATRVASLRWTAARFSSEYGSRTPFGSVRRPPAGAAAGAAAGASGPRGRAATGGG